MYEELLTLLQAKSYKLAAAESCTGGLVSAAITDIAGISQVYAGSITAYENSVKMNLLQVPESVLLQHGAVSEECAQAMALGAARALQSQVAVSTTGIAGPTGAVPGKPVGTVCMGYCINGKVFSETGYFAGSRSQVRAAAVEHLLKKLIVLLNEGL